MTSKCPFQPKAFYDSLQSQCYSYHSPFPNKISCLPLLSQSPPRINLFMKDMEISCPPRLRVKLPLPWNHSVLHWLTQYQYFTRNVYHSLGPHLPPSYHHQKHITHPLPQRERCGFIPKKWGPSCHPRTAITRLAAIPDIAFFLSLH